MLVAWEVDERIDKNCKVLLPNSETWVFEKESIYANTHWSKNRYYTLIIKNRAGFRNEYESSNKRNLVKANNAGLKFITANKQNYNDFLELFQETNLHIRGGLPTGLFNKYSEELLKKKLGNFHAVIHNGQKIAVSLVIFSCDVANIRYVTSSAEYLHLRPVNFLYDSICEYYFSKGFAYVDLSGIVSPENSDEKLRNISRFKRGFSNRVLCFKKIDSVI